MINFLVWCLQITVIVGVGAAIPFLLRLKEPAVRLMYWQLVLLATVLLPVIQPWQRETIFLSGDAPGAADAVAVDFTHAASSIPISTWVLAGIAIGAVIRFAWLLTGFWRMRQYRRNSTPLKPMPSWGAEADIRISADIQSPVTFGFIWPVVLLPANFLSLDQAIRDAILCHEIIHVRRKDWLFTLAEEMVRTALWFHPAIWWTLGEIQLRREQTVDREAIGMTRCRDEYLDALLAVAGANPQTDLVPAPLFLRRRHLKQRVFSILKEANMSKTRSLSALAASLVLLASVCWLVTGAIPLYGAPQLMNDGPGVAVETNGAQLMHRNSVPYPPEAAVKRVEGAVTVQVKLDAKGNVADAAILSGPDEFRRTVLQTVLNWHFAKSEANSTRQVTINFHLPKDAPVAAARVAVPLPPPPAGPSTTVKSVEVVNSSEQTRSEIMSLVPLHIGDPFTPGALMDTVKAVHEYDEHLRVSNRTVAPGETQIVIAPPIDSTATVSATGNSPIRVGGNIAQANLLIQPKPVYPPLAKEARIQGTVRFEATINPDGSVQSLNLISGPPLLAQAAMQAAQNWVYRPTLLNGNPVSVITNIDINFTLAQ
jgi:TonB family protein